MEKLFYDLLDKYGYQNWWPLTGKFDPFEEVCIGAVLTQNTSWKNVEKAIENLIKANLTSFERILQTDDKTLANAIRPSGFYNQKAKTLKRLAKFLLSVEKENIKREDLLSIKGIGKETADTILLYGLNKMIFVVDAYTKRLLHRLGFIDSPKIEYDTLRILIESAVPRDINVYKEFHALIVKHCKEVCKKNPDCKKCFLSNRCYNYTYG